VDNKRGTNEQENKSAEGIFVPAGQPDDHDHAKHRWKSVGLRRGRCSARSNVDRHCLGISHNGNTGIAGIFQPSAELSRSRAARRSTKHSYTNFRGEHRRSIG
jgi:hypothetical protein